MLGCSTGPEREEIEKRNMAVVRGAHTALASGDLVAFKNAIAPIHVRHCQAMPPGLQELHGKVVETWVSWDNVAFLSQLGLFPPSPPRPRPCDHSRACGPPS